MSFEKLFRPRSVAVVGASSNPSKVGYAVLNNLIRGGFEGEIFSINPNAAEILGKPCRASLCDVPSEIDLAVIIVKRDQVLSVLGDCAAKKVTAAIIITAGFGESDQKGKQLQKEVVQTAKQNRITIIGPNCLGVLNPWNKMNASFGQALGQPGHIALFSQSGALITALQDRAAADEIGFSLIASIGNKACVDEVDLLEELAGDPNTRVIAAYLEDISRGQDFMKVAEVVGKKKPIVILKAGRTSAGAKAASSHTGSLAGSDAAYACAFERCGIIRVDSIEQLFDVATALAYQPLPAGDRIGIVTNAGGPGIMMSDALEMAGVKVASLGDNLKSRLLEVLPPAASANNPVDVLGDASAEVYERALERLLVSDEVDGLIVILTPQQMTESERTAQAIVAVSRKHQKPVFTCFMGAQTVAPGVKILNASCVPQYPIPERATIAIREVIEYANYRRRPLRAIERFAVNKNPIIRIFKSYRARGLSEIGESDAKSIISAYDFQLPPGDLAVTVKDAVRFAEEQGYPLAMKISSPDILHKSDIGGVRVGLSSKEEVEDAFELMMLRVKRKKPDAEIRGVVIEKMAEGREVILGMNRDPQFGPMLMFGLGGIFVEVLKDVTFSLAPVTRDEAYQMIERTKTYKLLQGVRGQAGVDIGAIIDNILRLSQLTIDFPEIEEVDMNPIKVGPEGAGALVVDARIIISKE